MNKKTLSVVFLTLFLLTSAVMPFTRLSHAAETVASTVYLPLVMRDFPLPPTVFGAETVTFDDPTLIQLAVDARVSWIRIPAFYWHKIEPNAPVNGQHTYDWSSVPESSLRNIAANHMYAIATVRSTPLWAQSVPNVYCSSVTQEHLADFAAFMQAVVTRYSQPPYNVHYWELGNEPDIDPGIVPFKDSGIMGCWGDASDPYYGGGYYAEMLKVVYPAIKAADPQAQVLIGGLLLDCDPADPDCTPDSKKVPPKFFEGILRNGGGDYFDIVSFHGYPPFGGGYIQDEIYQAWNQRGGVVLGKAAYLRELMQQYGVDKPLLHTEGALLCPEWNTTDCNPPNAAYETAKSDYVVWLYTRALASDFMGSIWYTLDGGGWRNGGLIEGTSTPTQAYDAYKFITAELFEAQYTGQPAGLDPALRAYAFQKSDKTVWVVWSSDTLTHTMTTPAGYTAVYDKVGNSLTVTSTLQINSPVYIELP